MTYPFPRESDDVSCVLCGAAGLGIQTVEDMLARVVVDSDLCVFGSREYMSRVRGGNNSTELRVARSRVDALVDRIDILIAMSRKVRTNIRERIAPTTVIIGDREELGDELDDAGGVFVHAPLAELAAEAGGRIYSNSVAAGILLGILGLAPDLAEDFFSKRFAQKKPDVAERNSMACRAGCENGRRLVDGKGLFPVTKANASVGKALINGSDAVSLGAMAAGCNFVTAYPMSPATGLLSFFAQNAARAGAIVEQTEDELAAINMAVGASYAGARSMVTTSGGGFALMAEGISLAGVVESPVVIHLSQRPGPATGMATRTEQADLELALYSGHGEFPRAIYAPGSVERAFLLTQEAFRVALKYQTPAIVMTDQYFVNSFYNVRPDDLHLLDEPTCVKETGADYRRYEDDPSGCSPFGVPGFGEGIVGADSHEHDEVGHVYEDFKLRKRMQDKRMRKLCGMSEEAIAPALYGSDEYDTLIVCWGSTIPIFREALSLMAFERTALLAFEQIWPLHSSTAELLGRARKIFVAEGNSTGQFARLLRARTGVEATGAVLKYSGLQFSVEEAADRLSGVITGKGGES